MAAGLADGGAAMTKPNPGILSQSTICRILVVAGVLACVPALAWAQQPSAPAAEEAAGAPATPAAVAGRHIRGCDKKGAEILDQARLLSPTVARLVATLDAHDVVVYVRTGYLRVPGQLQVVGATRGVRYLCITLNVPGPEAELIAALAHELQHAVEVASAPEITDCASMIRYYETHGQRMAGGAYCTCEAQKTTDVVRYELAANLSTSTRRARR